MRHSGKWMTTATIAVTAVGLSMTGVALAAEPSKAQSSSEQKAGNSQERQENQEILQQTVNEPLTTTMNLLENARVVGLQSEFADIVTEIEIAAPDTLQIRYQGNAAPGRVADLLARVDSISKSAPLTITPTPVTFDLDALYDLAERMTTPGQAAAKSLGSSPAEAVLIDTVTGEVTAYVPQGNLRSTSVEIESIPVSIATDGEVIEQNRQDDSAPWAGGAQLRSTSTIGTLNCTLGFTWKKWTSNELMGGTAEHCYEESHANTWYNHGTAVGARYYFNTKKDSMLLRSSPLSRFSPTVFVGSATTTDIRRVAGSAAAPVVGQDVALSGGRSGLNVGKILKDTLITSNGKGPFQLTTLNKCLGGDSGGPWLTTYVDGRAQAHGQHYGILNSSTGSRCMYMPVTPISSALAASIAVW